MKRENTAIAVVIIVLLCAPILALYLLQGLAEMEPVEQTELTETIESTEPKKLYEEEENGLFEALPYKLNWVTFIFGTSDKPSVSVFNTCDGLTADIIQQMGETIYYAKEYCDSTFDEYSLDVAIHDEKNESFPLGWTSGNGDYGFILDSRSGKAEVKFTKTLDDLCAFFPTLRSEINKSKMDEDAVKIYEEVMKELNRRMDESEEKIFAELAPKYDMTPEELRDFISDTMAQVYSRK